ncbi:hypothetical protein B0H19DRAFT_1276466 [Mycena capillaripes]|nr:hypothetical protein B0H19DRAFT_1276466 [Mycena capillaripes]
MSPREERAQWMKKTTPRPVVVVMRPWSAKELIAARWAQDIVPPTNDQLHKFVDLYGGSARDAYTFARQPDDYLIEIDEAPRGAPPLHCQQCEDNASREPHSALPYLWNLAHCSLGVSSRERWRTEDDDSPADCSHSGPTHAAYRRSLAGNMLDVNYHRVLLEDGPVWPLHSMTSQRIRRKDQINLHVRRKLLDDEPVAWLSLQSELKICHDRAPQSGHGHIRVIKFKAKDELVGPLSLQTYYRPFSKVFPTFVVVGPGKAVVFRTSVGEGHGNVLLGFEDLKAFGINEIIYVIVTHTDDIDLSLSLNDTQKYPKITIYYLLKIDQIW